MIRISSSFCVKIHFRGDDLIMKKELIKRLTTYAKIDTQSDDKVITTPSTPGQLTLAKLLVEELKEIGMSDVTIDEHGYVMATLPANTDKQVPTIGFLAHVDTATDFTGKKVKPKVVENFDGNDLLLNKEHDILLSSRTYSEFIMYLVCN